jgi:hypothetical protein
MGANPFIFHQNPYFSHQQNIINMHVVNRLDELFVSLFYNFGHGLMCWKIFSLTLCSFLQIKELLVLSCNLVVDKKLGLGD